MALIKTETVTTFGQELTFENAYHEIEIVTGNKNELLIVVTVYDDSNKANVIAQRKYNFKPDIGDVAPNFYKQGYQFIKTLEEYSGAIDVLEEGQSAT